MKFSQRMSVPFKKRIYQFLLLPFFMVLHSHSYSQTTGYKNIKLGDKFNNDSIIKYYGIRQIATNGFRLNSNSLETFCEMKINHIDIKINMDSTINLIQVFTIENIYRDLADFDNKNIDIIKCIVNTVGLALYVDSGTDRIDGQITLGWEFEKEKCTLALLVNSIPISEKNAKRHYLIVWAQYKGEKKMW